MRARLDSDRRAGAYAPVLGWNGAVAIFIGAGFVLNLGSGVGFLGMMFAVLAGFLESIKYGLRTHQTVARIFH